MRVLHIGKFYPPFAGGMEYFLADLLNALQDQQINSAALVHQHQKTLFGSQQQTAGEPSIYRAPCYGRLLYAPISPNFGFWLHRVIKEFKPDLLHIHMPNTSAFWVFAVPAARRIPWLVHWHSDVVSSQIERRLALAYKIYRPLEQKLLRHSQAIIATSPAYLDFSPALQPWRDKCHVIALGLNPKRIAQRTLANQAMANKWHDSAFKILTVGRLTYYKGHNVLIQALTDLPDAQLMIVGEGEQRPQLECLIDTLGLHDRVVLLGWQNELSLQTLFTSCDVFCLPSLERTEAFGLVLLETMCFAKPVVVSDIPGSGVAWVVQQSGHGVIAECNNSQALSSALSALQHNPQQRQQMGAAGDRALHEQFHIKQIAQQTMALYQQVLSAQ